MATQAINEARGPLGYTVNSEADGKRALTAIASTFPSRRERLPVVRRLYLDTFDWRLYRRDMRLWFQSQDDAGVLKLESNGHTVRALLPGATVPAFASDLPEGPIRTLLAPLIDVRRLLPRAEIEDDASSLRILDDQQKTVARVQLVQLRTSIPDAGNSTQSLEPTIEIVPMRGYDAALGRVRSYVENDLKLAPSRRETVREALATAGLQPGAYSSKVEWSLDADMNAIEATAFICLTLLDAMLVNEDGVRRDLDPEFLHDFRVAGRRTRSALALMGKVFDKEPRKRFRQEFKWLGSVTGPVRDLDVHLTQMDSFCASLPDEAKSDLDPLGKYLRRHRSRERRRLLAALRSKRYRVLVGEWREFLIRAPGDVSAHAAAQPITEFASGRIRRALRRIQKSAHDIEADTPAESLHALRIDCKKLRYLLEFFYSLYDPDDIGPLVKGLKQLQDSLGDFNDRVVQARAIKRMAVEMEQEKLATTDCLLAMGRLLEKQAQGQQKERRRFARCLAAFKGPENRERFERLFRPPGSARE